MFRTFSSLKDLVDHYGIKSLSDYGIPQMDYDRPFSRFLVHYIMHSGVRCLSIPVHLLANCSDQQIRRLHSGVIISEYAFGTSFHQRISFHPTDCTNHLSCRPLQGPITLHEVASLMDYKSYSVKMDKASQKQIAFISITRRDVAFHSTIQNSDGRDYLQET